MSELPEFISQEQSKDYNIDAPEIKTPWASKNINKIMLGFSAAWFGIVLIYITQYFGWSNLFLMMPNEFGGFLAGVTLPLAAIWIIIAYIDRGTNFKNEAKFLRAYMNQLVYPEEGGAQTAKAMADAIRSQVVELQEVTKQANIQTEGIKKGLEVKIEEFSKLVGILDNYSSKTMQEFSLTVQGMVKNFEQANETTLQTTNYLRSSLNDFSDVSNNVSASVSGLLSSLSPQVNELKEISEGLSSINDENIAKINTANNMVKNFAEKTVDNINLISKGLYEQTTRLEDVSKTTITKVEDMHNSLNGAVKEIGSTLENQSKFVMSHIKDLDKSQDAFAKKMTAQSGIIASEVEKVVTRSSFVAEAIEGQVANLNTVADSIVVGMEGVVSSLQNASTTLEDKSASSVSNLNQTIDIMNLSSEKIDEIASQSISNIESVDKNIYNKATEWNNTYKDVSQKFDTLSQDILQKTQDIKNASMQAVEDIEGAGSVMDKYSNTLTQTCSLIVDQNKQSEHSLAQQQKNLNVSISSLEDARAEIKKQIEELSRAAVVINDEAVVAINNLKAQMEETLKSSEAVVTQTKGVNESLQEQSQNFEFSTNNTLRKMADFNQNLNDHYKELNTASNNVQNRSEAISATIEKQLKLVDETTKKADDKYVDILSSFDKQAEKLNTITQATVSHVSSVAGTLDEKAEAIKALFQQQENTFFDVCDKMAANTSTIANSLKRHTTTLEQSSDKVFARMTMLEEDVNKRAEVISQISITSMEKISDIQKHLETSTDTVFDKIDNVEKRFLTTSDNISANVTGFENSLNALDALAASTVVNVVDKSTIIRDTNAQLTKDSKAVFDLLSTQTSSLDAFLTKAQAQAEGLRDVFDNQKETLTDVANVVATQARLGETSLTQQYKVLSDASIEVAQKLNDIQAKFKDNMDGITELSGKVAYEVDSLGDRLISISEDVQKSSNQAVKSVQSVNMTLSQCEDDLEKSVKNSVEQIQSVVKNYEGNIKNFNTVTAEASTGVFEINNLILDQSDKMIKISEDTKELVACFNTVLNDTSIELSNRANFAFDKVKGLGDNLKNLSNQLEEAGKIGSKHLENSGVSLRATMAEISANAERISNSILGSGETFLKQSDVLVVSTDDVMVKVKNVMDNLDESAKTFIALSDITTQKTSNFSELVDSQIVTLQEVATKADAKLSELLKGYANNQTDSFLKEASFIIETLETSAVDINRLLHPENVEELWKKYYNGDNSVFVRHLSKNLSKPQITAIRKTFEENADFRKVITRYLSEFETLLTRAQANERSGVILSVLTSADIGRVYYILAKALDKLN